MIVNWLFKQMIRLQIFMYRRSGGKQMGALRGMPLLLLTTIGRKTGMQRVTPVMYIRDGENYVIIASNAGREKQSSWFVNLRANPQTTIEVGDMTRSVTARQASGEERDRLWAQFVAKAPFFEDYKKKTTRQLPVVVLQVTDNHKSK